MAAGLAAGGILEASAAPQRVPRAAPRRRAPTRRLAPSAPSTPQQPSETPRPTTAAPPQPSPTAPAPAATGAPQAPTQPPQKEPTAPAAPGELKPEATGAARGGVSFRLENADLMQFINLVAGELKINYVIDPAVKGAVTITTAGELRPEDLFPILQAVLKINGATAIQVGNLYRIVPLSQVPKTPLEVFSDTTGNLLPTDDRMVMQIIPLRFVFAADMAKMCTPFLSDGGNVAVHEAGNILILVDNSLNVKRLMEIIQQFDSATFAQQRIQLLPVHNNVASGLIPELESIFSAYALSDKKTPLRFVPIDRINALLVVTPDPSAFAEVARWVEKLDQPAPPSGVQTFVYRVQNSEASYLARLLTRLQGPTAAASAATEATPTGAPGTAAGGPSGSTRESALAGSEVESGEAAVGGARITTDPVNNSLLIQGTAQQYAEILKTLKELDVVPREVMIEARVYEVTLSGDLSFGVSYFLQQRSGEERKPLASFSAKDALQASAGTLVGKTRELLGFLNASENRSRVRVLSAPTVLAMDNSDAKIQVGSEIPILTSQGVIPGVQTGVGSVFANTIQNRDTGIILTVTPRITSTGMVSLRISQEISSVQPAASEAIQSPSFLKRSITTRAVVADRETIALGGLIQESVTTNRNRIPLLGDIPGLGVLFGSTSYTRATTELIVLLTPHIVKNAEEARDATRELREGMLGLRQSFKKDKIINP